jgi:hypothetical protein
MPTFCRTETQYIRSHSRSFSAIGLRSARQFPQRPSRPVLGHTLGQPNRSAGNNPCRGPRMTEGLRDSASVVSPFGFATGTRLPTMREPRGNAKSRFPFRVSETTTTPLFSTTMSSAISMTNLGFCSTSRIDMPWERTPPSAAKRAIPRKLQSASASRRRRRCRP